MKLGEWVIYGPCKAINDSPVSDITVEPVIDRDGRKSVGISFNVEPKNQTLLPFTDATPEPHPAFRLAKVSILPETQKKYLALRSEEEIALCIERANEYGEQQEKNGKPPNYGALYHAAIQEGWHAGLADRKAAEEAAQARKKAEAAAKRQAAAEKKARAEKSLAESESVLERFRALPAVVQAESIAAFLATDPSARGAHQRKGFDSPLFLFPFVQYLKGQNQAR